MKSKTIRLGDKSNYLTCTETALYGYEVEIDKVIHDIAPSFLYDIVDIESNAIMSFENRRRDYKCVVCGSRTTIKNGMCWQCTRRTRANTDKPSRAELKQMIRTMPFTHIASKYNKSDNAVRKWCISYDLPTKQSAIKAITDVEWENI